MLGYDQGVAGGPSCHARGQARPPQEKRMPRRTRPGQSRVYILLHILHSTYTIYIYIYIYIWRFLVCCVVHFPPDKLSTQLFHRSIRGVIGRSVGRSVGWSVGRSVDQLLVDQLLVDRPGGGGGGQTDWPRQPPGARIYIYIYIGIENRAIKFFLFGVSDIFSHSPS